MKSDWIMMLAVQLSLWSFYALLPCFALRHWLTREVWPVRLALALLAGVVSQAILGWFWSSWIRQPAAIEGILYIGFWIGISAILWRQQPVRESNEIQKRLTLFDHISFGAMILIGFTVRLLHPFNTFALGQSDAYTHLAMFREIITTGYLGNAAYPPGYAWIMAMPAAVFHLDPYFMARFGGAFLGVALLFSVYIFLREGCRDRRAAVAGAFLVTCFPGLMLLLKTGVGAFANQAGLFLLPLVFTGVLLAGSRSVRWLGFGVLGCSLIGIVLTVPMLLLHIGLVLSLYMSLYGKRIWRLFSQRRLRWLWALVPLVIVGGLSLLRFGARALSLTTRILTTADEAAAANLSGEMLDTWTSIRLLLGDFFCVKHWGLGRSLFDGVFILLFIVFIVVGIIGLRRRKAAWVLMGCWGGLTTLQTATGFLQFTAYQREGWSLLIAIACMGGITVSWFWSRLPRLRSLIVLGMLGAAVVTLWHPPAHPLTNSTAEEAMVRVARMIRTYPQLQPDSHPAVENLREFLVAHLAEGEPLSLITRPLMQDQMLSSVAGSNRKLWVSRWDIYLDPAFGLNQSPQSLVFLDRSDSLDIAQLGSFANISPVAAQNFLKQQRASYEFNDALEAYLQNLSTNEWRIFHTNVTPELRIYAVSKNPSPLEGE